jgi:transposase-like protein
MELFPQNCPYCQSQDVHTHTVYSTVNHGKRVILRCQQCDNYFSETKNTPIAGLKTPLSQIIVVLKARSEGIGLNAAVRVRLKNKGSQNRSRGRKKPKYQAFVAEHPDTNQDLKDEEIHANHVEGFNASVDSAILLIDVTLILLPNESRNFNALWMCSGLFIILSGFTLPLKKSQP